MGELNFQSFKPKRTMTKYTSLCKSPPDISSLLIGNYLETEANVYSLNSQLSLDAQADFASVAYKCMRQASGLATRSKEPNKQRTFDPNSCRAANWIGNYSDNLLLPSHFKR